MSILLVILIVIIVIIFRVNSSKIKGSVGEFKVNTILSFLNFECISLHDMMIRNSKGSTSQIDHLVLSEYGIFVIETKNYKGWIFGNEKSEYWTQVLFKEKHKFRNPVKQNWSHIYALKDILFEYKKIRYYPIVVFSGNATLKDIESSVPVIYESSLNQTIRNYSTEKCLTNEEVLQIKNLLESKKITEKGAKKEHVEEIHQSIFEKQLKKESLICPRCNSELKLREGKYGKFYGCSNYPNCRFTMKY
ncbi:NERD domain-containing protein [Treponema brennaborense]|uniref:NERD domain protein n=1 Tax=Treponema brennaborense (strain DSM 12168 / CIP 105900 / DD5/3) TaxID=906968 RepID=F4LLC4_TREBD|nr:NERD domain-containing protein [Treponema brennaborense]AEE15602.1 NERD domain protein [Treponema brennaborense DSM 12168]